MSDAVVLSDEQIYLQGLGRILFTFQLARWNIVELGNLLDSTFIVKEGKADFANTAQDFQALSAKKPEWVPLCELFLDATSRFNALLACTPYSDADGHSRLGSSDAGKFLWSDDLVNQFIEDLQKISSMATDLSAR